MTRRTRAEPAQSSRVGRLGVTGFLIGAAVIAGMSFWANSGGTPISSPTPQATDASVSQPTAISTAQATATEAAYVETDVVERPGVPSDLHEKYWSSAGQVGLLGTTARMTLPSGEMLLAVGSGYVVSAGIDTESGQLPTAAGTVTMIIRDFATGRTVRTVQSDIYVAGALIIGQRLFWVGPELSGSDVSGRDGGVSAIDLSSSVSSVQVVVPRSDLSATYGEGAIRGLLRLTDRGRAFTTQIVSPTRLVTEVVDVEGLKVRGTIEHGFMYAFQVVGNRALLVLPHELSNVTNPLHLQLFDVESGEVVGDEIPADLLSGSIAITEREVVLQRGIGLDSYITKVDLASGETNDLRVVRDGLESLSLSPSMSAPAFIVLVPANGGTLDDAGAVNLPVSLLDPQTGDFESPAFTIGEP